MTRKPYLWLLAVPTLTALAIFFLVPLLFLLFESAHTFSLSSTSSSLTIDNYYNFITDEYYWAVLARTFYYSFLVSLICLVLAFPVALLMARTASPQLRALLLLFVVAPLLVSVVVRTFGWFVVLGEFGVLNKFLSSVGVTGQFVRRTHLFNEGAVILGLVHVLLPVMVLTLYSTLQKQSPRLVDAARNLGANSWRAFAVVTLPLSMPGVIAGSTAIFAMASGSYVSPAVLGGSKVMVMSILAYQQAFGLANWPFGSAISVILLVATLLLAGAIQHISQKRFSLSFEQ